MKAINILFVSTLSVVFFVSCQPSPHESMMEGKFEPTWESLSQYGEAPEWFQDAKFGIWAHWGPQCQPEQGDWYARGMYDEGGHQYNWHVQNYGHPSEFGFKDVINLWKAEEWNPDQLMVLYKKAGAKYFFTLGNHHDNFDLWDSKYQSWNSVNMGPKKDIVAGWEKAARANDLYFGVSIHSAHAWTWYETAQRSDKEGPMAGIPYDGKMTKEDGKGKWWEGYDPQDLYAQDHSLSKNSEDTHMIHSQWGWGNGASIPSEEYSQNFFDRTVDMINKYNPDLVYYDDTSMPLWPFSDQGLRTVTHFYNKSLKENNGENEAVVFAKILTDEQKECLVWDVEKGIPDQMQDKPWQTCTCIGHWHYDKNAYDNGWYKSAETVVHMLIDIISKNGNMLLSVPMKGNGAIDDKVEKVLEDIASWMEVNEEAVFGTRVWKIFGEGPIAEASNPLHAQGFNEGKHEPYTSEDIRFVTKGDILYAHVLAWPENNKVVIKSLADGSSLLEGSVKGISLLGSNEVTSFTKTTDGLVVNLPKGIKPNKISLVLKINCD
ncbi:alpha-L-fucosidase [Porphyromonadaceae bacterium KH3CP3RA]|nr:alpha-L-fucosidase [Porphyromonadaceae bacterium KH3CP3RA]